ncbi:hypothetical protein CEXT_594301 [Caerostris extrusa]|uniref:Uncharacterized protein n=1 Tax=Caerostris extrusa TaxID=172846 RepID=A0AAV4VHB6_CAEEX|nr:hypothetical protein CEXT_594301 [Caerostris extrusa]
MQITQTHRAPKSWRWMSRGHRNLGPRKKFLSLRDGNRRRSFRSRLRNRRVRGSDGAKKTGKHEMRVCACAKLFIRNQNYGRW